jgi:predicted transcriptional regulator
MTGYNTDFAMWAEEQAARLRAGRVTELDRDNIAEELESLARALRDELFERLARLLQNLVQWDYLDGMRLPAWYVAITEERGMIPAILKDAPSLQANWSEAFAEAWQEARGRASGATGLSERLFPRTCPYSPSQAVDTAFWPGEWNNKQEGLVSADSASRSICKHMRTVTLGADSRDAVSARFVSAMKGNVQGNFITFASPELLFQTITEPRWQIIKAMTGAGPLSLREVAQRVGRDVEAVQDDVRALLDTGVLEPASEEAIVFPYEVVHVDFTLTAPHD